jgi:UDP-GlcNAc:undecaprenyl-phosphate/decaprenyl-phosphate GlcNAc-1-phosphate transferase
MSEYLGLVFFYITLFFVSFLLHKFFLNRSKTYSLQKANTNAERWSSQTKPVSGGITFYIMFILASLVYYLFPFYSEGAIIDSQTVAIIIVLTISFLMGLADDIINTSPYFKFFVQILNSFILIKFNLHIDIFENQTYNYIITTLWVIGIMNSVNMLDNMDAITSSVSLVIIAFSVIAYIVFTPVVPTLLFVGSLGVLAAISSFLFFNWSPAKMYMGDNGSQFLGSLLAIIGIAMFWNSHGEYPVPVTRNFTIIALVFLMPLCDTTTVTINRIFKGKSPFTGGKDHTTHHLSYMGLSDRKIALVFIFGTIVSSLLAFLILWQGFEWSYLWLIVFGLFCVAVFSVLFSITKIYKPEKK